LGCDTASSPAGAEPAIIPREYRADPERHGPTGGQHTPPHPYGKSIVHLADDKLKFPILCCQYLRQGFALLDAELFALLDFCAAQEPAAAPTQKAGHLLNAVEMGVVGPSRQRGR